MVKLLLNQNEVINQYNKLKNIHKVAKHFNVSITPIKRILEGDGLEITNRRYPLNDCYFDKIDTEEKSYWLGFLYADGYIRERKSGKSLEMKLSIKDKTHLEKFRESLNSNHLIKESYNKVKYKSGISESHMCHLAIYSTKLVESVKKHGIHSRKTFSIEIPDLPKEMMNHFVRGYFDGDGSFSFNPKKYKIHTNIVCASEKFRNGLMDLLSKNEIKTHFYGNITIDIQDKIGNINFYNYIYSRATIYLKRKKEKYEEFRRFYK